MSTPKGYIKQQTLLIGLVIAFACGFVAGTIRTVYHQSDTSVSQQSQPENTHTINVQELEDFAEKNPDSPEAWRQLGHAYFDTNQPKKAIDAYKKFLALSPGDLSILTDLGVMYRRSGQADKAIATFDQVLDIDASHEQARFNKGVVLLADKHDPQAGLDEWKKLVEINQFATGPNGTLVAELIDQIEIQMKE